MGLREAIAKAFGGKSYRFGVPNSAGGLQFFELQTPPSWNYQSYLKAYGEIGWLFACVNIIAQATAKVPWHLYQVKDKSERTELFQHDIIGLLNHINPFQSRYQFFYFGTMYKLLVGEEFWQINFKGGRPYEMWLAPPAFMSVIPSPENYISHYEYRRNDFVRAFTVEEIIHIKTPNPLNEYRGLSPAQALTIELDSERYAGIHQQKMFFNQAIPAFTLEYPAENMPPAEQRKELMQEWDERYRGFRNSGKTAFLFGAKANVLTINNQQMQFAELRRFHRDAIMAAYHVPPSKLGIVENVNRANAIEADYDFQNNCVLPELCEVRESLNKELIPLFGDGLYLDFENPVPRDVTQLVNNAVNLFKGGLIRRNEGRYMVDLEPDENPEGEEYFTPPPSGFGLPSGETSPKMLAQKKISLNKMSLPGTAPEREAYWKDYVVRAEPYEARIISELQAMFLKQQAEVLAALNKNENQLLDIAEAKEQYIEHITPPLTQVMAAAVEGGRQLLEVANPHSEVQLTVKQGELSPVLSARALAWLRTRIGWAAEQVGEDTAARLAQILAEGYRRGLGIAEIAKNIEREFAYFSSVRAQRIARTEVMQAAAQGSLEGYRDSGIVQQVEFYTALDERVCPECMPLHQQIFSLEDSAGIITVHPNCRCVWLPVLS